MQNAPQESESGFQGTGQKSADAFQARNAGGRNCTVVSLGEPEMAIEGDW